MVAITICSDFGTPKNKVWHCFHCFLIYLTWSDGPRCPDLETVCCSMSSSNSCFLTCIQVSQEADQVVWYSRLFQNFPQFIVIHTVKGFGLVNKAEVDVFLNCLAFSMIQWVLAIWSLVPLPSLNPAWTSGSSRFRYYWSHAWRILSITLLASEMNAIVW